MNASTTQALITGAVSTFGYAVLAIITATLALGLAYLVFRFGWSKTKSALNDGASFHSDGDVIYGSQKGWEDQMGNWWKTEAERDLADSKYD